jgi:DNA primase
MHGRCVFPIHNAKGELVAYAGRSIDGTEPRYKFPAGFHKSQELFNLHRVAGDLSVVLVEGFFDCMKVSQAGYSCVALMGSTMSPIQERMLAENLSDIIVMLDGDEAGRGARETIANRLRQVVFKVGTVALPDGVQPDQLSDAELRAALDGLVY